MLFLMLFLSSFYITTYVLYLKIAFNPNNTIITSIIALIVINKLIIGKKARHILFLV